MASVLKNIVLALFDMGRLDDEEVYVLSKMSGLDPEEIKHTNLESAYENNNYTHECYARYVKKVLGDELEENWEENREPCWSSDNYDYNHLSGDDPERDRCEILMEYFSEIPDKGLSEEEGKKLYAVMSHSWFSKEYLDLIKPKLAEGLSFEKRFDTHISIPKTEPEDGDLEYVYRFLYSTFSVMNLEDALKNIESETKRDENGKSRLTKWLDSSKEIQKDERRRANVEDDIGRFRTDEEWIEFKESGKSIEEWMKFKYQEKRLSYAKIFEIDLDSLSQEELEEFDEEIEELEELKWKNSYKYFLFNESEYIFNKSEMEKVDKAKEEIEKEIDAKKALIRQLFAKQETKESKKDGLYYVKILSETPEEERTEELCLKAVKEYGFAIRWVPKDKRTKEICLEALRSYAEAVFYVPEEMRTEELYLKAVQEHGPDLSSVPKEKRTEEMCLAAVKENGLALLYVPEEMRTEEICLEAVRQDGTLLQYVPEEKCTEEICLEAVMEDGDALQYVPEKMRTEEICLEVVNRTLFVNEYVPEEIRPLVERKLEEILTKLEKEGELAKSNKRCSYAEELGIDLDSLSREELEEFDKEIEELEEKKALTRQLFAKHKTIKEQEEQKQGLRDSIEPNMPNIGG